MSHDPLRISGLREEIEALDRQLLRLLRHRMQTVEAIAQAKIAGASPFRDPVREELVIDRVRRLALDEGLDPHQVERMFRGILDMSVAWQQRHIQSQPTLPLRVAYQGVEGAYSHLAAQKRYAGRTGGALLEGFDSFRDAAEAVRTGAADVALLPIENTTSGSIYETYDLLADTGLVMTGEVVSVISHRLLGVPGARLEDVRRVLSHPQALRQCDAFLRDHPWMKPEPEFNTAGAAKKVSEGADPTVAAIASEAAGQRYGLSVLAEIAPGTRGNFTRFIEVARAALPVASDVPCKTSLLFQLADRPGALAEVLQRFAEQRVNLTKLESRPLPESPFRYRFYLDVEGHAVSQGLSQVLESLRAVTTDLRVLGTYPRCDVAGQSGQL